MRKAKIIVAKDIEKSLIKLGYEVCGIILSGVDLISKIGEINTDLILMDIKLIGEIDGIKAAELIKSLNIPIIYL